MEHYVRFERFGMGKHALLYKRIFVCIYVCFAGSLKQLNVVSDIFFCMYVL